MGTTCLRLVTLLLLMTMNIHAATTWTPPVDISPPSTLASDVKLAVDPAGNVTAVWSESDGTNVRIYTAQKPFNSAWGAASIISSLGLDCFVPDLAVDPSGNLTAIWFANDGTINVRIQSASKLLNGPWTAPVTINTPLGVAPSPSVVVDDQGNATATWAQKPAAVFTIVTASKPFGGSWSAPQTISPVPVDPNDNNNEPSLGIDGSGNVTVAWRFFNSLAIVDQILSSTKPFGGSFQTVPDAIPTNQPSTDIHLAVASNGTNSIIWQQTVGLTTRINSTSRPAGGSYSSTSFLSASGQNAFVPDITVDPAGIFTAVWTQAVGFNLVVQSSTQAAGGSNSWSVPVNVSASSTGVFPQVATDAVGTVTVVWQTTLSGGLIQASTKPFGGAFQAVPDTISTQTDSQRAKIAVDPKGNATAAWQLVGSDQRIQASERFADPRVLSISPNQGVSTGGTQVILTGVNLTPTTGVFFGAVPATAFIINSDTQITAIAPPGTIGSKVNVIVTVPGGSSAPTADNLYTYISPPPAPPTNLTVVSVRDKFASQEEYINKLRWGPSAGPSVIYYNLYRNGHLIAQIPANEPLKFNDHNQPKYLPVKYVVTAVNIFGIESSGIELIVVIKHSDCR